MAVGPDECKVCVVPKEVPAPEAPPAARRRRNRNAKTGAAAVMEPLENECMMIPQKEDSPEAPTPAAKKKKKKPKKNAPAECPFAAADRTVCERIESATLEAFDKVNVIGQGSYGRVLKVVHRDTGVTYAMKVMSKATLQHKKVASHVAQERRVFAFMQHPFIVDLRWAFQTPHRVFLVMEYMAGGELWAHLQRGVKSGMREGRVRFYSSQIVLALEYMHKKGLVYRDLKPENIVLSGDGYASLTDFGFATYLGEGTTAEFCGTLSYMSPEMVDSTPYGCDNDWWSFGVLMYHLLVGEVPWSSDNAEYLYDLIREAEFCFPKEVSPDAKDLITSLLTPDPAKRLRTAEDIRSHPFYRGLDWDAVLKKAVDPPFKPQEGEDLKYFDDQFTCQRTPSLSTPHGPGSNCKAFAGFDYAAPVAPLVTA